MEQLRRCNFYQWLRDFILVEKKVLKSECDAL